MSNAEKARLLANLRGVAEQASTSSQAQNISDTFQNKYSSSQLKQPVIKVFADFKRKYELPDAPVIAPAKAEPIPVLTLPTMLPKNIYSAKVQEQLKRTLQKPQLLVDLDDLLLTSQQQGFRIVNTGLLKAGKSTLYNCLVDAVGEERFKTGTVRTTITSQEHQHGDFIYIDTPGIDHVGAETQEAIKALKTADIVLFIHNLKSGEFDKSEVAFLQEVSKHWGNNADFIKRTVFVMTHLADVEAQSAAIISQIDKQVTQIFGASPLIKSISSMRYRKGLSENKQILIERSGIPSLVACLHHQANALSANISQQRMARLNSLIQAIELDIQETMAILQNKRQEVATQLSQQKAVLNEGLDKIAKEIEQMLTRYNQI
jgi:small GTP-binding protein